MGKTPPILTPFDKMGPDDFRKRWEPFPDLPEQIAIMVSKLLEREREKRLIDLRLTLELYPENGQKYGIQVFDPEMWKVPEGEIIPLDLRGIPWSGIQLPEAIIPGANLQVANLRAANLKGANLSQAILAGASLEFTDLQTANLVDANLSGTKLEGANLQAADFSYTSLRNADLRTADLRAVDLTSANLENSDLRGADLAIANLVSADLSDTPLQYVPPEALNIFIRRHFCGANSEPIPWWDWKKNRLIKESYPGEEELLRIYGGKSAPEHESKAPPTDKEARKPKRKTKAPDRSQSAAKMSESIDELDITELAKSIGKAPDSDTISEEQAQTESAAKFEESDESFKKLQDMKLNWKLI